MKKYFSKAVLLIAAIFLSGILSSCTYFSQFTVGDKLKQLRVGMTKAQVLKIMGKPVDEVYTTPDVWYYYTDTKWHDFLTTSDECTPLVFKNGKLQGWGNDFYNTQVQLGKINEI